MKRLILTLSFFALALVGCGGSGGGATPSVYVGTYAGTYNEPSVPENGTVNLNVDQVGNLSGTTTNSANHAVWTIAGTVDNSDNIQGSLSTSTTNNGTTVVTTVNFAGTFTAGTPVNNTVPYSANLTITIGASTYSDTWNLTQTATGPRKRR